MGKKGPCFHCGIQHTPLWRNGPPEKPILCNACGSRYRTWGDLTDYMPKHALNGSMVISNKDTKIRQQAHVDNDASTGSGPGSAISSSDNCIQLGSINEKQTSGLALTQIPRKKRSALEQYVITPVDRLQRQLYCSLQESKFSKISLDESEEEEDVLIFQKSQIPSDEIGLGCVLLESTAASREEDEESDTDMMNP